MQNGERETSANTDNALKMDAQRTKVQRKIIMFTAERVHNLLIIERKKKKIIVGSIHVRDDNNIW